MVLYELLTGVNLFEESNTEKTLHNVSFKPIPPLREVNPDVPEPVDRIVLKALERDSAKRYPDAGTMVYDLEYYMYHDRYGPTNQSLRNYLHELLPDRARPSTKAAAKDLDKGQSTIQLILDDLNAE